MKYRDLRDEVCAEYELVWKASDGTSHYDDICNSARARVLASHNANYEAYLDWLKSAPHLDVDVIFNETTPTPMVFY